MSFRHGLPELNLPVVTLQQLLLGSVQEGQEPQANEDTSFAKTCQPYHHPAGPHGILWSAGNDNHADG